MKYMLPKRFRSFTLYYFVVCYTLSIMIQIQQLFLQIYQQNLVEREEENATGIHAFVAQFVDPD